MFDLAVIVPIALMSTLLAGYAKELVLLPILAAILYPTDPLRAAIAAFVTVSIFNIAARLVKK